jgi:hypothetical protein
MNRRPESNQSNRSDTLRWTLDRTLHGVSSLTHGNFHGPTRLRNGSLSPRYVIREYIGAAFHDRLAQIPFADIERQA